MYPSATGNLLYQLDERGQRIADFSDCGYRGGTEPLPNVTALIAPARWVYVSPGAGDDTALIQAAIDSVEALTPDANGWRGVVFLNAGEYQLATTITIAASGVVLKGAGDSSTTGTRLRATDARQYVLVSASGTGSRATVSGTTHNLTQKLVSAGARTFEVDSTSGLAVGHTVIVKRPSTANWIADMDMDQLGPPPVLPWTAGSKDLSFDRVITRIEGNWITVDAPLPQTFESLYGGGQIWRYTWSTRIQSVGIEDIYGFSDYASSTDEAHAWTFIRFANLQHGWVRNITAQYFGNNAVLLSSGTKWVTIADAQCLDPISIIDGGRRYSFSNEGAQLTLFVNNYARQGRHDFVLGATVPGPNAFVQCSADTVYSDTGPHHRWAVGGLFDGITVNGNEINAQNRGNLGTGHGWSGAYMAVWNCAAASFRVRNPPTARNWLVGSVGPIYASAYPVGADPAGTYDSSGTTGKAVHPRSLYYGQLQQRLKWPDSEFREVWLGDVDQHDSTGGTGDTVNCDAAWLAQVAAIDATPADALFDKLTGDRRTAFTFDFVLDPGDTVVAASLTVSLRAIGPDSGNDDLRLDSTTNVQTFTSLGWTPISTTAPTVRTVEISPALLADGRLNVAVGDDSVVDFAVLHLQVQKAQPSTHIVTLTPVADAYVQGGVNAAINFGTATSLQTKDITASDVNRESYLRWDLSGVSGKIVQAKVRLAGTGASQVGNESCATFVSSDTWGETTITFNNKPASGKLFAQWIPVTGQPVEFSVTPQVADTMLSDGKLSLRILSTDNFGGAGNVSYASREHGTVANRPQLILTFENTAPTISNVANQTVNEDTATGALPVTIGDDFTAVASLTVSGASSNTTLVPNANIVFGGSAANRTVTVTPAANQSGTSTITLSVSDGALTTSDTFVLTVTAVNDAPTISNITDRSIAVNTHTGAIPFTIGDIETATTALTLTKTSSDTTLVPTVNIVFGGSGASRNVTLTPTANKLGSATITVTVSDGALTATDTFLLTITGTAMETWRFASFGTTANTGASADTANPDGDAWTNAEEYVLGTNPMSATSSSLLTASRTASNLILTFTAAQATGSGYAGLTRFYDVETTTSLANAAPWTGLVGYTNFAGANQTVTITQPIVGGLRFYRLKVRLQ